MGILCSICATFFKDVSLAYSGTFLYLVYNVQDVSCIVSPTWAALSHRKPTSAAIRRGSSGAQLNFLWLCHYFPRRINQLIFVMVTLCSV
jgi:hypothetical protein